MTGGRFLPDSPTNLLPEATFMPKHRVPRHKTDERIAELAQSGETVVSVTRQGAWVVIETTTKRTPPEAVETR